MLRVAWVSVARREVRLRFLVVEVVRLHVSALFPYTTLFRSEIAVFWWRVTVAGVTLTMLVGEPVTVKCTAMSALARSRKRPQPGSLARTEAGCGALNVVREVATLYG